AAPMESQIEPVTGQWQMRIGLIELRKGDEAGALPERAGTFQLGLRQTQLREVSAARFTARGRPGRRIGARLEQRDRLSAGIAQPQLMQLVLAQARQLRLEVRGDQPRTRLRQFGQHETHRWRGHRPLVQPEVNAAVAEYSVT